VGSLAKVPQTPGRDAERLQERLRFCVLGVHPSGSSLPQFLALTRPDPDVLRLDPSAAAVVHHAEGAPARRLPNWRGGDELYLGAGQLTGPSGEKLEFGTAWLYSARTKDWPVLDVARTLGFDSGKMILDTRHGVEMLTLSLWPREFELRDQRTEALAPFRAKQEKIEDLQPADRELSQLLGITYVAPPTKPEPKPVRKRKNSRTNRYEANQADLEWNRTLMRNYDAARASYTKWLNYTVHPEKRRYLRELQREMDQIEANYREPLADAPVREAAYKAWLESSPEIRVTVYRLVPYESAGRRAWIRVLVVESAR
jgi:hypothetical protein